MDQGLAGDCCPSKKEGVKKGQAYGVICMDIRIT